MRRRPRPSAGLALAAILALAAALRLTGIRYGLPYPLLDPDEGNIVPRAWGMAHVAYFHAAVTDVALALGVACALAPDPVAEKVFTLYSHFHW